MHRQDMPEDVPSNSQAITFENAPIALPHRISAKLTAVISPSPRLSVLDLFSGIGGFSYGLERTGWFETKLFCEVSPFCRKVLAKHWPDVPIHPDVRTLRGELGQFDVIAGGFPCTEISFIGAGAGLHGQQSGLWNEFKRLIAEVRPRYAIIENVAALRSRGLEQVLRSLSSLGYDAEWHCIPASAVGAPHRRDRLWILAHPSGGRDSRPDQPTGLQVQPVGGGSAGLGATWVVPRAPEWPVEPGVRRTSDGLPHRVDRTRALGNAIVPQVVELVIAPRIIEMEKQRRSAAAQAGDMAEPTALLAASMQVLAEHLPPRASFRQGLAFLLIAQAHAEGRNFRVADLLQHGFGDGVRRSYQVLLAPSLQEPDGLDWVYQEPDPRDKRQSFLRLTPRGLEIAAKITAPLAGAEPSGLQHAAE